MNEILERERVRREKGDEWKGYQSGGERCATPEGVTGATVGSRRREEGGGRRAVEVAEDARRAARGQAAPVVVREQRGGVEGTGELRRAVGLLGDEDLAMGGSHACGCGGVPAVKRSAWRRRFGAAGGKRSGGWASTGMASGLDGGVGRRSPGCGRWSWQLRRLARRPSEVRLRSGFFLLFFRCLVVVVFLVAAVLSSGEVAGRGVQRSGGRGYHGTWVQGDGRVRVAGRVGGGDAGLGGGAER
ncbi:uncharacterized protein M6B38_259555 [Iris pallida]|uniref:Uncharacterized protein n=1 Tax=Iris pallida TaxID=29817 RepID=A0AAX6IE64_IRIPA|nr:uncharacterized protein M6B38_259555 [Iris pallida]